MPKHRILILTNRIPFPLNDGGALAMHAMLQGYYNAGWEIFLLSMNSSRHYTPTESLPKLFQKIGFESYDINTDVRLMPTLRNFFLSRKPNHAERFYEKGFNDRLVKIVKDFEPELVQIESVYLATYIPSIRAISKAKIALRLHNIEYQIWERLSQETSSSFRRYYLKDLSGRIRRFELQSWLQADILIPITEQDQKLLSEQLAEKEVILAPFGINLKRKKEEKEEHWTGYHIGAMDWLSNSEAVTWFLEEVWPELHRSLPDFRFYFAGRNMPGSFEKFEKDGVVCAGEVPDADEFISDKKILIVPLRSGGGVRVKILEAMAAGKVVISTSVGIQGIESAKAGQHFLLAETKEEFISQIGYVLSHKEEAAQIAFAASEMVSWEYDQGMIISRLVSRLHYLLGETGV